jgi:hypothetical protein
VARPLSGSGLPADETQYRGDSPNKRQEAKGDLVEPDRARARCLAPGRTPAVRRQRGEGQRNPETANKTELIDGVASYRGLSKADSARGVGSLVPVWMICGPCCLGLLDLVEPRVPWRRWGPGPIAPTAGDREAACVQNLGASVTFLCRRPWSLTLRRGRGRWTRRGASCCSRTGG